MPHLAVRARRSALALALAALSVGSTVAANAPRVDVLIRDGLIVDGTGSTGQLGDVEIVGDRIAYVGPHRATRAHQVVDAQGMVIAPGFIDIHNHSDAALLSAQAFLNESFLRQGVTTVVLGPDGELSPQDIAERLLALGRRGAGTNVAFYVGHNGIRTEVLGAEQNRAPSGLELARMERGVREGMQLGAVGLSSGLMYSPGLFSETDELIALARQVAPFGGVYSTHVRDPHHGLLQSDWEAIEIARQAGIAVNLTHLSTPGKHNRGLMRAVIDLVESARQAGVEVVADQYPYAAVATKQLWSVLNYPPEFALDTRDGIRAALREPAKRARIRQETLSGGASGFSQYKASGPSSILILSCPDLPAYEGRFISDVAAQHQVDGFEAVAYLLESSRTDIIVSMGGFYEEDLRRLMRQPWAMIASDGFAPVPGTTALFASAHPRAAGTFARVLGKYVREEAVLTLEEAIRKATGAPAAFLKLKDRGSIAAGHAADLVIFDPQRIADRATWSEPDLPALGMIAVLVNGRIVVRNGVVTGVAAGRFLPRAEAARPLRH